MKQVQRDKLKVNCCYSRSEITEMGMKQLKTKDIRDIVFEKDFRVYYFEELKNGLFRLFCATSRQSFYL